LLFAGLPVQRLDGGIARRAARPYRVLQMRSVCGCSPLPYWDQDWSYDSRR